MGTKIGIRQNVEIRVFPSNHKLLYVIERLEKGLHYGYYINDTAYEIIKRLNGKYTYEELIQELSKKYSEDSNRIMNKVNEFIEILYSKYSLEVETKVMGKEQECVFIKDVEFEYPIVASLEVTNNCNIRCRHCYGEYGERNIENMPLNSGYKLLEELEELGVKIIELTGGDVTVYSNFADILRKALELKFSNIAILTNGIAISEEIFQLILENRERILVQIDLHSLNEEYYDWFTQSKGQLKRVKENIERLANNDVRVNVAVIVTPLNVDELVNIADWVNSHNIHMLGISVVMDVGRCKKEDKEKLLFIHEKDLVRYEESLEIIDKKYPNLINKYEMPTERNNCGAITANFVISSNGKIKMCTMDNLRYCNSSIGNVFEKSVKDIFDSNSEFIQAFGALKAPDVTSKECEKCENQFFCSRCVLRGIIKSIEKGEECEWFRNQVPTIIKQKLFGVII